MILHISKSYRETINALHCGEGGNAVTNKELQKLGRPALLALLLEQAKQFEELEQRLNAAEAALESRQLQMAQCGSIAEASLKLNGVFEAAQAAAEQYRINAERIAQEQAEEILRQAREEAAEILRNAENAAK